MRRPIVTIFYQYNPWRSTIGGIQTTINSYIKHAPGEFEIRLVGTTDHDSANVVGRWQEAELLGRELSFMPVLTLQNDNVRTRVPTTLRYTLALLRRRFESDFMHFHRLEPTLAALPWNADKTLFVHNDIHTQIKTGHSQKEGIFWQRMPMLYFAAERLLIPQFAHILSCNSESVKLYRQQYPKIADRVSLVKNTVDNDIFYPLLSEARDQTRQQFAQKLSLPTETRFILFAGRLHPQKDPLLLIQAMAALGESNVHLLIAGEGELRDSIQAEIIRLNISQSVTILGAVAQTELADLHRLTSVFVLTSLYEGLPLVALESLLCGTPVVTTQSGETPNLLTANSGIVCQRSPSEIANALRRVLNFPSLYPPEHCAAVAKPYSASDVISQVYSDMLERWNIRNPAVLCA
jgi:glycosyltransferase involved in cell wall biosynthesis